MLALNNPWLKTLLFQQHVRNDLNWRAVAERINSRLYTLLVSADLGQILNSVHLFKTFWGKVNLSHVFDLTRSLEVSWLSLVVELHWSIFWADLSIKKLFVRFCPSPCADISDLVKNVTLSYLSSPMRSTPSSVTWLWRSSSPATAGLQLRTAATIPLCTTTTPPPWYCRELRSSSSSRLLATWWQAHREDTQECCRGRLWHSRPRAPTTHIPAPPRALLLFTGRHWTSSYYSNTPTSNSLCSR